MFARNNIKISVLFFLEDLLMLISDILDFMNLSASFFGYSPKVLLNRKTLKRSRISSCETAKFIEI